MTDMHHHTKLSFVHEFRWVSPLHYLKTDDRNLFFFGACCKRGRHLYTTTAPSCFIPSSYCRLSATLQTMSIIVVSSQDNRVVFRIFIALLRFLFDSPSYYCSVCLGFTDVWNMHLRGGDAVIIQCFILCTARSLKAHRIRHVMGAKRYR